jgi:PS-10 peptidase S37
MKFVNTIIAICLFSINVIGQLHDIEKKLYNLPDVIFKKIETPAGFESAYELRIRQALDQADESKGHFYQKVYLSHRSVDAPTVIITEGYENPSNRIYELTDMLKANQVKVEHRYFGESIPDSLDYTHLNLKNATADLHRINTLLRSLYPKDWVSTGISKGGQTTIFYRYFYPSDVDVSVPYVAPLNTSMEDARIYQFLDTIGTKECRDKIYNLQKTLLENRQTVLEKIKWYAKGGKLNFTYLNLEEAFEYAVLEYSFSFWQWGSKCEDIPTKNTPLDAAIDHFLEVSGVSFFSDSDMKKYSSHYYQAGTEMGYYGYDISKFKGLIKALPSSKNPSAVFMPKNAKGNFDGTLTNKVYNWVQDHGDQFVYIYGANDTWSATAVRPNSKRDALWYFLKGKDHAQARIKNLPDSSKKEILAKINQWLATNPN